MTFDIAFMFKAMLAAAGAIPLSLAVAFSAVILGSVLGMPLALLRFYKVRFFAPAVNVLFTIVKGIPIILLYFTFYVIFGTTAALPLPVIVVLSITIVTTLRMSNVFLGSLESIEKTQFEAAYSVGHTAVETFFRVVLPQMVPVSLPVASGVIIQSIKAVPIAILIGLNDILNTAISEAVINYRYLEAYIAAALIFWGIFLVIEKSFLVLESKFSIRSTLK